MTTWVVSPQPPTQVSEILGLENGTDVLGTEDGNILAGILLNEWTNATVVTDVWAPSTSATGTWTDTVTGTDEWTTSPPLPTTVVEAILIETGNFLLQENGGHILDEQSGPLWVNS